MIKIIKSENTDFFNVLAANSEILFKKLPRPIPWIEPGINMIYLESVSSYIYGNFLSSIMIMAGLLEHVLRLCVMEKDKCGTKRKLDINALDKYKTLNKLLEVSDDIDAEDKEWWLKIKNVLRNKSAHILLPALYEIFYSDVGKNYTEDYRKPKIDDYDFGTFFHRAGEYIALGFIKDATIQISKLISKTNWYCDTSWWISQKHHYDSFFDYDWDFDNFKLSLEKYYSKFSG